MLGNLGLFSHGGLEGLSHHAGIETLAELGVIVLLFEVGLESTIGRTLKVGLASLVVAGLGVIAPFVLGFLAGRLLLAHAQRSLGRGAQPS